MVRKPVRQFTFANLRQVREQLGEIQLRIYIVPSASAGQTGQDRRRSAATRIANESNCSFQVRSRSLPKHPMAEAVNYALSQWTELNVFCSDGAVSIDNNISERSGSASASGCNSPGRLTRSKS